MKAQLVRTGPRTIVKEFRRDSQLALGIGNRIVFSLAEA
jgi:hypothetical protein